MPALECRELLAKSEVFEQEVRTRAERQRIAPRKSTIAFIMPECYRRGACGWQRWMLLNSKADRILANDRRINLGSSARGLRTLWDLRKCDGTYVGEAAFGGTLMISSKPRPLEASPRPVCLRTRSHVYTRPSVQRVRWNKWASRAPARGTSSSCTK